MKAINEAKFFKQIPWFFEHPSGILTEIAQNSYRSGATGLDIELKDNILTAKDNGCGIGSPEPLLVLADSAWAEDIEENQNPAGWGLFFLYSIAYRVFFRSKFGSIVIDCGRYLSDAVYRENILGDVSSHGTFDGFYLEAVLKEVVSDKIDLEKHRLEYFPLSITLNGNAVERKDVGRDCHNYQIKDMYKGNPVYIKLSEKYYFFGKEMPSSISDLVSKLKVIWYGIPIVQNTSCDDKFVIDVRNGSPLTPVLPYRHSIKHDKKLEEFWNFIRKTVADYCISYINDPGHTDTDQLVARMGDIERVGTQAELVSRTLNLQTYTP
jgi:hypothetical protein